MIIYNFIDSRSFFFCSHSSTYIVPGAKIIYKHITAMTIICCGEA